MSETRLCCNCLHCARWKTSKGVECHCDLTDRYLSYLDVMDIDNSCCRWEKETKWDIQKQHDNEVYNKAIDDFISKAEEERDNIYNWDEDEYENGMKAGYQYSIEIAEQLKCGVE